MKTYRVFMRRRENGGLSPGCCRRPVEAVKKVGGELAWESRRMSKADAIALNAELWGKSQAGRSMFIVASEEAEATKKSVMRRIVDAVGGRGHSSGKRRAGRRGF